MSFFEFLLTYNLKQNRTSYILYTAYSRIREEKGEDKANTFIFLKIKNQKN